MSASNVPPPDPRPMPLDHLTMRGEPNSPALVLKDATLDYAELEKEVGRLAAWLSRKVPEEGARVASWAAKGRASCLLPLAAARAGLVYVPINPLLKRAQVAHIVADSGSRLLIGTEARLASLEDGDLPADCATIGEKLLWDEMSRFHAHHGLSKANTDDLVAILYTSGSTGRPKGVMLSHANLWLGAVSVAHYLELANDDVTLAVLPLSFDYGQNQLLSTWYAGGSVAPLDYLFPRDVAKACERHGVTTLAAVPPLWVQLTEIGWPGEATASLRRLTNSGGALTPDLIDSLRDIFPQTDIYPMYGLTEAFRSTYLDPELVAEHPTSMGRAIPFAEVLVVDDEGAIASDGEEGELVHCGPLVAQGYWQDPDRTAERFRPAPGASKFGGTAVWSGDRVVRDAEGLLYFAGRRDAMIKTAGNRVSPQEIEEAAIATGLAKEAVALGLPDERLGQAIHLVLRGERENETALSKALAKDLPNFMQPQAIHWREKMPTNPNGKLDRVALKAQIEAELAQ